MDENDTPTPAAAEDVADASDVRTKAPRIPVPVFNADTRPQNAPPFMVVDGIFIAQTEVGEFSTALRIPEKTIRLMEELLQREQFEFLLKSRHEDAKVELLGEMDSIEAKALRSKYFQAHFEREQARLGELFGSSDS